MLERVWIKEIRLRMRKNGKWGDWETKGGIITIYGNEPECEKITYYEERAVEFRRVEPETI